MGLGTTSAYASGGSGSIGTGKYANAGVKSFRSGFKVGIFFGDGYYLDIDNGDTVEDWDTRNGYYLEQERSLFILPSAQKRDNGTFDYWQETRAWSLACYTNHATSDELLMAYPAYEGRITFLRGYNSKTSGYTNGIFYQEILNAITTDYNAFVNGGWKTLLTTCLSKRNACLDNWEYITGWDSSGTMHVQERINECFGWNTLSLENYDTWKDDEAKCNQNLARYLDLLYQLYAVGNHGNTSFDGDCEKAIEILVNGEFKDNPFTVSFVPAVTLVGVGPQFDVVLTDCLSFMCAYFALGPSCYIKSPVFISRLRSGDLQYLLKDGYGILEKAVSEDLKIHPLSSEARISSWPSVSGYNAFSWGSSGMWPGRYVTRNNVLTHKNASITDDMFQRVWNDYGLTGAYYGGNTIHYDIFYGMFYIHYLDTPNNRATIGKIEALPDDSPVNPKQNNGNLGQDVQIKVHSNVKTETNKIAWDNILTAAEAQKEAGKFDGNYYLYITVTRQCDYDPWNLAPNYQDTTYSTGEINKVLTIEQLREFINGNMDISENVDFTNSYPVEMTGTAYKVTFTYTMDLQLKATIDGKEVVYEPASEDDKVDTASFLVPEFQPDRLRYVSTQEAYAELKNYGSGSNQTGTLSEDYEVMAGVPTTEQLYFAAGGSEFIVDVSFEYCKDDTAIRSYTSFFSGTECEYHGVGKDGMTEQNTGSYSKSGTVAGSGHTGSWSVKTTNTNIVCGCDVCSNNESCEAGDWVVTIAWEYKNETTANDCSSGEHTYYTNGSEAFNQMIDAIEEIEASMDADAEAFSYTAASDGVTRYGAAFEWSDNPTRASNDGNAGSNNCEGVHGTCGGHPWGPDEDGNSGVDYDSGANCSPGGQAGGSGTITGTWTAHHICGPCCSHHLPDLYDTWSQSWTYDSLKIIDAHVWRIDQAAAKDLSDVIGPAVDIDVTYTAGAVAGTDGPYENPNGYDDGIVGAKLKAGIPTVFYNIAMKNSNDLPGHDTKTTYLTQDGIGKATESSVVGRIRYNLNGNWTDASQHDMVYYNLGTRTNHCDGMAKTLSTNDIQAGGGGHAEEWADGFIYNAYKGKATHHGMANPTSIVAANAQTTATAGGNLNHTATSYWTTTQWNQAGQTLYPLDQPYYLQLHCDGWDGSANSLYDARDNSAKNSDVKTEEYAKFWEKRNQPMQATMITDFMILQTTSGDQSLLYYTASSNTTGYYEFGTSNQNPQYDKDGNRVTTTGVAKQITAETMIPTIEISQETMWDNNALSSAKWLPDHINVGGYNGNYTNPNQKFKGTGNNEKVTTLFDQKDPAGTIVRTPRPTKRLMLYSLPLNIIAEISNKSYLTSDLEAEVFWANAIHWSDKTSKSMSITANPIGSDYSTTDKIGDTDNFDFSNFKDLITVWGQDNNNTDHSYQGIIDDTKYSKNHDIELNGLVIQDQISTSEVALISLPDERDQRYANAIDASVANDWLQAGMICPGTAADCEFAVLNCKYGESEDLGAYYFNDNTGTNSVTKNSFGTPGTGWTITGGKLTAASPAVRISIPLSEEFGTKYQVSTRLEVNADITINDLPSYVDNQTGALKTRVSQMLFGFYNYGLYVSTSGKIGFINSDGQYREATNITLAKGGTYHIEAIFSMSSLNSCEVTVNGTSAVFTSSSKDKEQFGSSDIGSYFNIGAMGSSSYGPRATYDNITVERLGGTYAHTEDCYITQMIHPSGMNAHKHTEDCILSGTIVNTTPGKTTTYSYTGGMQSVTLQPGTYKLEAWGAQGGNGASDQIGGKGGYSTGILKITTPTTLYIGVGGSPGYSKTGGWNGGGTGGSMGAGGGGMTHISTTNNPSASGGTESKSGSISGSENSNDLGTWFSKTVDSNGSITATVGSNSTGYLYINNTLVKSWNGGSYTYSFKSGDKVVFKAEDYNNGQRYSYTVTYSGWDPTGTLLVAGGGGGAGVCGSITTGANNCCGYHHGGAGGGITGGQGQYSNSWTSGGAGGTQTSGYAAGQGGSNSGSGAGGGGGWYGGYAGNTGDHYGGGGGSGYVNTSKLTSTSMSSGVQPGHGKVVITPQQTTEYVGYDKYKQMYENGELSIADLKEIFGEAYEDLFSTTTSYSKLSNFTNTNKFSNFVNCDLKTYSGNLVSSITGSSPSFILNQRINADEVLKMTVKLSNNTTAKTAKIYWSSNGTFTEANSITVDMEANGQNQVLTFALASKAGWTGTVNKIKFCIPAESDKNYGGSISISSIDFAYDNPDPVTYTYKNSAQSYKVNVTGYYLLEAWGAQGGNGGGKGGYTKTVAKLTAGQTLYIYTGGKGTYASSLGLGGGYNGGGNATAGGYGGGGMTHITTSSTDRLSSTVTSTITTLYPAGKTWDFSYTGGMQSITLQPGTYKLETWGAQGGNYSSYNGGLGGYSSGQLKITTPTTLYIGVGGQGGSYSAGWNGGGYGKLGGGGATHIALSNSTSAGTSAPNIVAGSFSSSTPYCWVQNNSGCTYSGRYAYSSSSTSFSYHCSGWVRASQYDYGVSGLAGLANNKDSILIVAGGGGGAGDDDGSGLGGYGGGANSSGGNGGSGCGYIGYGGTLTAGGSATSGATSGSFGQGGSGYNTGYATNGAGGGGGGYYGGGGSRGDYPRYNDYDDAGAGGGSGYANTNKLTNISGQNGTRSGNGFARITAVTAITTGTVATTDSISFNPSNVYIIAGGGGGNGAKSGSTGSESLSYSNFKLAYNSDSNYSSEFTAYSSGFKLKAEGPSSGTYVIAESKNLYTSSIGTMTFNYAAWKDSDCPSSTYATIQIGYGAPNDNSSFTPLWSQNSQTFDSSTSSASVNFSSITGSFAIKVKLIKYSSFYRYHFALTNIKITNSGVTSGVGGAGGGVAGDSAKVDGKYVSSTVGSQLIYGSNVSYTQGTAGAASMSGGTITIRPSTHSSVNFSGLLQKGKTYTATFTASSTSAGDILHVDAYPDDLPETTFKLTTTPTQYQWTFTVPSNLSNPAYFRIFSSGEQTNGTMTVANIYFGEGTSSGSGQGGTQTSGYKHGMGQSATDGTAAAGAGGGYWGGKVTNVNNGGAGGGSGYLNTSKTMTTYKASNGAVYTAATTAGQNTGNGKAKITFLDVAPGEWPTLDKILEVIDQIPKDSPIFKCNQELNTHVCDDLCRESVVLKCNEPHHSGNHYSGSDLCYDACMDDAKHKQQVTIDVGDGSYTPGNFINIDWGFQMYFANKGDFYQSNTYGIGNLTNTRGIGYENDMDTSTWTRVKQVKFNVNVIYQGNLYNAGEWVTLSDKGDWLAEDGAPYDERNWSNYGTQLYDDMYGNLINGNRNYIYDFYCVLANHEEETSPVEFRAFSINNTKYDTDCGDDANFPTYITNRLRQGKRFESKHSAFNLITIDVVGRIGNLALIDTGDYRFSNLFKKPLDRVTEEIPDPDYYTVIDEEVEPNDKAYVSGDGTLVVSNSAGGGAVLKGIDLEAGAYRIYVNGDGLTTSGLSIKADTAWTTEATITSDSGIDIVKKVEPYVNPDLPNTGEGEQTINVITVSGPGIELKAGQSVITLYGTNLSLCDWDLVCADADMTPYITSISKSSDKIVWNVELPNDVTNFGVYAEYRGDDDLTATRMEIRRLSSGVNQELASSDHITNISVSDNQRVYYVILDTAATVDISTISRSKPISVESIGIQKVGDEDNNWVVEGIVRSVDESQQNNYLTWKFDIRGLPISAATQYIDTYNTLGWAQTATCLTTIPLDSTQNNISILQDEALLVGYDIYASIGTIGDYYRDGGGYLQLIPEYYGVDITTGEFFPVDVYIYYDNAYYPINIWGLMTGEDNYTWSPDGSGYTLSSIYNFATILRWNEEKIRRMVTPAEEYQTNYLREHYVSLTEAGWDYLDIPTGNSYVMGNAQFLQLNGHARTFVGGETTYSELMNYSRGNALKENLFDDYNEASGKLWEIGSGRNSSSVSTDEHGIVGNGNGLIEAYKWWQAAQRWHLTLGLASSSVFVRAGLEPTTENIAAIQNENYVVLSTVDIRALGQVWNLIYTQENGSIKVTDENGMVITYDIPEKIIIDGHEHVIPPALVVYQTVKSSPFDIDVVSNY